MTRRTVRFSYASWEQWARDFEAHGMMVVLKQELPPEDFAVLLRQARDLVSAAERPEVDGVDYDEEYLEIIVDVPA